MPSRSFPYRMIVKWSESDRAFIARVPALPAFAARGHTRKEATDIARSAAEAILEVMREDGQPLPPPESWSGAEPSGREVAGGRGQRGAGR
jgi:predicted RNase H-like HicB family nuclease